MSASESPEPSPEASPRNRRGARLARNLGAAADWLGRATGTLAESIVRKAASATELISDSELRRRAGSLVGTQAVKGLTSIQTGVATSATHLRSNIAEGPRQIQGFLARLQRRVEEQRLQALLQAERDAPVDVQVGPALYEDAPQELRSRLWIALLEQPELGGSLHDSKVVLAAVRSACSSPAAPLSRAASGSLGPLSAPASCRVTGSPDGCAAPASTTPGVARQQHPLGPQAGSTPLEQPTASVNKNVGSGAHGLCEGQCQLASEGQRSATTRGEVPAADRVGPPAQSGAAGSEAVPSPRASQQTPAACHGVNTPVQQAQASCNGSPQSADGQGGAAAGLPEAGASAASSEASAEDWAMVQGTGHLYDWHVNSELVRRLNNGLLPLQYTPVAEAMRKRLLAALMAVGWPLSVDYPEDCRYNTLLQISVGQEEVDEVISRDIHRTFPEHPQFGFAQGQQALFRVLKAYSLHDLEVGYCQGMAFVAGVVLMYVPEEPAFRLLVRLLSEPGPGLRSLYLPGLEGLKDLLRALEYLLERLLPALTAHLQEVGAAPVLYASQWFLTVFSCPFPAPVACRVIDVMLAEGTSDMLLRTALAVMADCAPDVLQLSDFEDVITYLKVEPGRWAPQHVRRVLNTAVDSAADPEMLRAARQAVAQGYEGSLSRRSNKVTEAAAAAAVAAAAEGGVALPVLHRRSSSLREAPASAPAAAAALPVGGASATDASATDAPSSAAEQQSVDEEYMTMLLALPSLWSSAGDTPADEATSLSQ